MTIDIDHRRVLIVDDQSNRAQHLIDALGMDAFEFDVANEVPDLQGALGPDSPWDCVLCNAGLINVSWASVRRAMRNFDVQVPVIVVADEQNVDSMKTAVGAWPVIPFVFSTVKIPRHSSYLRRHRSCRTLWMLTVQPTSKA